MLKTIWYFYSNNQFKYVLFIIKILEWESYNVAFLRRVHKYRFEIEDKVSCRWFHFLVVNVRHHDDDSLLITLRTLVMNPIMDIVRTKQVAP